MGYTFGSLQEEYTERTDALGTCLTSQQGKGPRLQQPETKGGRKEKRNQELIVNHKYNNKLTIVA